jgi:hypothetical protein
MHVIRNVTEAFVELYTVIAPPIGFAMASQGLQLRYYSSSLQPFNAQDLAAATQATQH